MAAQRGRHRQEHRSQGFAVRRWLQLGVASAGMGAALLGYSVLGPQTGTAAADTGSDSSVSRSADTSRPDRDDRRSERSDGAERDTANTPAVADDGGADRGSAVDSEDISERVATALAEADTDAASAATPTKATATKATPIRERRAHTRTETSDATPAAKTTSNVGTVAPQALPPEVQAAIAEEPAGTARQQRIAKIIDNWTNRRLAYIESLSVTPERKAELEASMWATRRAIMNQTPTVAPVQITGKLDGPITGTLNAVDPDGDAIRYVITVRPREGTVVINDDGTYEYTPNANFDGVDVFRVAALDGFRINIFDVFRGTGTRTKETVNQRAITFAFDYTEGAGYWTDQRRAELQRVADNLTVYFVVDRPVELTFEVTGDENPTSSTLAWANSGYASNRAGFRPTVVQHKLLTGRDANGATADGRVNFNFGVGWGFNGVVAADQYDFDSTAIHELLHAMGFMSGIGAPGDNEGRVWRTFADFVVDRDGRSPFTWSYRWNSAFDGNLEGADGGLFFGGKHAVAAYGGLVPLYTPGEWESGSSMSHLDDDTFTGEDEQLMNANSGKGPGVRVLSPIEIGILRDLGYTVFPLQPDYLWAFAGLVLLRRRRPKTDADVSR
ncbi:Ig-like domain-containing protein [Mycobacterium sp. pV006]|uniref:Ig-like domain-containing protein n=1 Tax=Mycobacterium sp. pV006 TaxID=3238983 RepID=UPI00351B423F